MSKSKMAKAVHGVFGVVYAMRKDPVDGQTTATYGEVKKIPYAKSIGFKIAGSDPTKIYANNEVIDEVPGAQWTEGSMGVTSRDPGLETDLGSRVVDKSGDMTVFVDNVPRSAIGYCVKVRLSSGETVVVKRWIYNTAIDPKIEENSETDEDAAKIGNFAYNYKGYGEDFVRNGKKIRSFCKDCWPGDTGYDAFLEAVVLPAVTESANVQPDDNSDAGTATA